MGELMAEGKTRPCNRGHPTRVPSAALSSDSPGGLVVPDEPVRHSDCAEALFLRWPENLFAPWSSRLRRATATVTAQAFERSGGSGLSVHVSFTRGSLRADVLAAALAGLVSQGDQADAPIHLQAIGGDAKTCREATPPAVSTQNASGIDPRPITVSDARRAVRAAERLVSLAEWVVSIPRSAH
jgi:hypothetical protein